MLNSGYQLCRACRKHKRRMGQRGGALTQGPSRMEAGAAHGREDNGIGDIGRDSYAEYDGV